MRKNESNFLRARKKPVAVKTAILCSVLLLFVVSTLQPADFGLKFLAGWTQAGVNSDRISRINRLGFGGGFEVWFFKLIGLEVDAIYTVKGYRFNSEAKDHDFAEISFPVLLKARLFLDGSSTLSLSILGGGVYSRFLTEMDQDFEQYDFGIIAGASLEKRWGKVGLLVEGRYNWGLRDQSDEYMPFRFSFKTRTFFLLAGVNLHF
jgi:hypothetical protein